MKAEVKKVNVLRECPESIKVAQLEVNDFTTKKVVLKVLEYISCY